MAWTKRYVRADANGSGDGTTNANTGATGSWTLAQAIAGATAGMKMIVLAVGGTYANTTTNRNFVTAGTTTAQIWWAGANAAEDDLASDYATARPVISFTTAQAQLNASHNFFSCLDFTGQNTTAGPTGGTFTVPTNLENVWFDRCRFANTAANSGASAFGMSASSRFRFTRCRFEATATAACVADLSGMTSTPVIAFSRCVFVGGGDGCRLADTGITAHFIFHRCCFRGVGAHGISDASTAASLYVLDCSFRPGTDGVRLTATRIAGGQVLVADTAFGNCGGVGINNTTGVNTGFVHRVGNLFGAMTGANETGLGDTPSLSELSDGATSPFTSATDLTLVSTSAGRATADAGAWPGEAFSGYGDRGGVQHPDAGGGGTSRFTGIIGG